MLSALPREAVNKILALREDRKKAISSHKYERAREIDEEIAQVKTQAVSEVVDVIRENFRVASVSYLDRFADSSRRVVEEAERAERLVRTTYQKMFEALKESHHAKLLECEKQLRERREHEEMRSIRVSEDQAALSEKAAAAAQYDEAIRLRDEARAIAEKDVSKRLKEVSLEFDKKREKLFAAFGTEIEGLSERLTTDLKAAEAKKGENLAREDANRDLQLSTLLAKAQGKLAQVGAKDQQKTLEADLHEIVTERGYPMPSTTTVVIASSGLKGSPSKSKMSKSVDAVK
jgi:hypothetical protein